MDRMAQKLAYMILIRNYINDDQYDIYKYGFKVAIEIMSFIIMTTVFAVITGMFIEYIILLFVFGGLRSYTNGAHLSRPEVCLVVSVIVFGGILLASKYLSINTDILLVALFITSGFMWFAGPMNDSNYIMDQNEKKYFTQKLRKVLVAIAMLAVGILFLQKEIYFRIIVFGLLVNAISMLIGKIQFSKKSS